MLIIADTREKDVLEFPKYFNFIENIVREKLDVGDYACRYKDGFVAPVIFERKAIGDLFGTLTDGYERFKEELIRAKDSNIDLIIVIEGSLTEVKNGFNYKRKNGNGVWEDYHIPGEPRVKQLETLWSKHGIERHYCTSRSEMSYFIYRRFYSIGEQHLTKEGFKLTRKKLQELL